MTEPPKLHGRRTRHIEELRKQIEHSLDRELDLLAEERRERARRFGINRDMLGRKQLCS